MHVLYNKKNEQLVAQPNYVRTKVEVYGVQVLGFNLICVSNDLVFTKKLKIGD